MKFGQGEQREGMGLLEYQAMPSLRDIANDGWLCTFIISQQLEIPQARIRKAGGRDRPSHTKSHLSGHSPPASQGGCRVGPAL